MKHFYFTFIVTLNCQAAWTFFKKSPFVLLEPVTAHALEQHENEKIMTEF